MGRRPALRPPRDHRVRSAIANDPAHPRTLLADRGLRPRKSLGQHFLTDRAAARRIATLCVGDGLRSAVEVGPGTGVLTEALLAAGADVRAVEIDPAMVAILGDRPELQSAEIVLEDALAFDYDAVTEPPWCACGNLPYNVGTPLVLRWLELQKPPQRIVVMLQRDVADRLTARPSTAAYGSLTVAVRFDMEARRAFTLQPGAFYPRPKVDSAVVVLERRACPAAPVRDRAFFMQVVRGGFAYRRKTFANSLALGLGIERSSTRDALVASGLDPEIRAEQLDLDAFAAVADRLAP